MSSRAKRSVAKDLGYINFLPSREGLGVCHERSEECTTRCTLTHPLPPLKRGISGCFQILRRDAPLDDNWYG